MKIPTNQLRCSFADSMKLINNNSLEKQVGDFHSTFNIFIYLCIWKGFKVNESCKSDLNNKYTYIIKAWIKSLSIKISLTKYTPPNIYKYIHIKRVCFCNVILCKFWNKLARKVTLISLFHVQIWVQFLHMTHFSESGAIY